MKLISDNPVKGVVLPKREKIESQNYFSVQELHQFLKIVKEEEPYKNYALFRLLAYSGLRKGELYSLRWSDLDFDNQILSVSKNLGRINGKALEKSTKNKFSVRQIRLDQDNYGISYYRVSDKLNYATNTFLLISIASKISFSVIFSLSFRTVSTCFSIKSLAYFLLSFFC